MANNQSKLTKEQQEELRLEAYVNRILREVEHYEELNRERYAIAWS